MLGIRRNSLSYKTAVLYVVLTVLIVSVFNFIIWENQSDLITRNQQMISELRSLRVKAILARQKSRIRGPADTAGFRAVRDLALRESANDMRVFTEAGAYLYPARGGKATPEEQVVINRAVAKYELEDREFHHELRLPDALDLFLPAQLEGGENVVFRFRLPIRDLERDKDVLLRLCLLVTAVVVALQAIFALFLRKIVIVPITRMERATHEVSKGDFSQVIDVKQDDEIGMLSQAFNEMIRNLARIQEEAKGSNPLTGLPGNNVIIKKIDAMIASGREFAVIYGDLDNFKAYNDKYGFSKGDDAILFCRDCFQEAAKKFGDAETFVGHEGGDDFVVVTGFHNWEAICKGIISAFDAGVPQFYNEADAKQGFIDALDRQGRRVRFPLMSISLAVASNHFRKIADHRLIVQIAAEMKKYVKKTEGSVYAIDKRVN